MGGKGLEKKKEILTKRLKEASEGGKTLEQIAAAVKSNVQNAESVNFANPMMPNVANEPMLLGMIWGLKPNVISSPVIGEQAVYVVQVKSVTQPPQMPASFENERKNMNRNEKGRINGEEATGALRDAADVKDFRYLNNL